MSAIRYELDALRKKFKLEMSKESFFDTIYESVEGVLRMILAILHTHGENWVEHVLDAKGNPMLTEEEKAEFREAGKPLITPILLFFNPSLRGGYTPEEEEELAALEKNLQAAHHPSSSSEQKIDDKPPVSYGPDNLFELFLHYVDGANKTVRGLARNYGTLKLENDALIGRDIKLIPGPAREAIGALAALPPVAKVIAADTVNPLEQPEASRNKTIKFMENITSPPLLLRFILDLALDVAHIMAYVAGEEDRRKTLSIVISLLDLSQGKWKRAIFSFMGYYGSNQFLIGQMGKAYLTVFNMLDPTLQNNIVYGVLDVTKSFIIGLLLTFFKITAPELIRLRWIKEFDKMALIKQAIDGNLNKINLPSREEHFAPDFSDLNNLQALLTDPAYICSTEFLEFLKSTMGVDVRTTDGWDGIPKQESASMAIILQILRIPTTKDSWIQKCGTKEPTSYLESLIKEGTISKEKQDMIKELKEGRYQDMFASSVDTSSVAKEEMKKKLEGAADTKAALEKALQEAEDAKKEVENVKKAASTYFHMEPIRIILDKTDAASPAANPAASPPAYNEPVPAATPPTETAPMPPTVSASTLSTETASTPPTETAPMPPTVSASTLSTETASMPSTEVAPMPPTIPK